MNSEELETLNFIRLYESSNIELHKDIDIDDIFIYLIDNRTCCIFDMKDIYINGHFKNRFVYDTSIKKTIYTSDCVTFTKYYHDSIVYPFMTKDNQYKYDKTVHNYIHYHQTDNLNNYSEILKANFYTQLEKVDNKYQFVTYANNKLLNRIISNKKSDYKTQLFIDILYKNIKNKIIEECELELSTILKTTPKENNIIDDTIFSKFLKSHITLYDYQKRDILWMNKIKQSIDNNENVVDINLSIFYNVHLNGSDYLLYNRTLIPNLNSQVTTKSEKIHYYGGNIISEVGLGKSIIVLSHILQNSNNTFDNFIEFEQDNCNYFYKRGKNKGESCQKKKIDELYCKEHSSTLFIDKRSTIYKNLDNFNLRDFIITKTDMYGKVRYYFKTNANLILCPNQLCDQWVREYYEKFKQGSDISKRILLIVTYDQYKNLTLGDILFADIIVVSYNFLMNTNYSKKVGYQSYYNAQSRKDIMSILDELDGDENINSIEDLLKVHHEELGILDNYYYDGIYLDESHEIINKSRSDLMNKIIKSFQSTYRWNITATPFPNGMNSFLTNTNYISSSKLNIENIFTINKTVVKDLAHLYRRNTKQSIQDEFAGNIITEDIKLLDFTEQERTIYNAHLQGNIKTNRDFLIKLCCDTSMDSETKNLVKNCKTLDEIQNVMLAHNKKLLTNLSNRISNHKTKIENLLSIIDRGVLLNELDDEGIPFENIEAVKSEIGIYRRKLTNHKKEYDTINRTYTYLKNAVEKIKEVDTCPICLDDIASDQIAITKCGHKFCKDCIYEFVEELNTRHDEVKCPKCNVAISVQDIYLLAESHEVPIIESSELNDLIQRIKSTKIGNIIYYLRHEMKDTDKCIIFSQWDSMLTKIGKILKQEKVDVLYCTGTVYQRKRAINKFQNDLKSNIIFLSSENCASGINLTSANKIILIEPIYGDKDYRKDIENQAIGRADRIGQKRSIEIIRFIIKDSIEEEIFRDNEIHDKNSKDLCDEKNYEETVLVV